MKEPEAIKEIAGKAQNSKSNHNNKNYPTDSLELAGSLHIRGEYLALEQRIWYTVKSCCR